jgi:cellulose synthase/poly-beta-1,6-N-acetylglucosamine synthase-like glycosyltransferase
LISILVLTFNEEKNIQACLNSVRWSDDIVVLDSGSTDRTLEIARSFGAKIFSRSFDNEKNQREEGIRLPFKYSWVYNPDADEVTPVDLSQEMKRIVESNPVENAFRVRFRNMFMNKWVKRSSLYPTMVVRLFRPECLSFERSVNLTYIVQGKTGLLKGHFDHYSFNNGMTFWFDKHNRYSQKEAEDCIKHLAEGNVDFRGLFGFAGPVARRRALKELSFRLPFRPFLRFCYMFFLRFGFLDGVAGFHYCLLLAIYEYMIVLKMREIRGQQRKA